jgi:hypothetical protein
MKSNAFERKRQKEKKKKKILQEETQKGNFYNLWAFGGGGERGLSLCSRSFLFD